MAEEVYGGYVPLILRGGRCAAIPAVEAQELLARLALEDDNKAEAEAETNRRLCLP